MYICKVYIKFKIWVPWPHENYNFMHMCILKLKTSDFQGP